MKNLNTLSTNIEDTDSFIKKNKKGIPLLPGGFGRSTYYTGSTPRYAISGEGYLIRDDLGNELIDTNNNFTTLIHGNAHPQIIEAATEAMKNGSCWGIPNTYEWEHAELLLSRLPSLDQVRYTNSGTEAVMTAIRIARASTGRSSVIMTKAGYHGSSDIAMCAGSGNSLRGIPKGVQDDVTLIELNNIKSLEESISSNPNKYAAIVLDLIPNRAGLISITKDFAQKARDLATRYGIVLIIDEVISLRLGYQGLSGEYQIKPDLLTTGKLIGGGFPVGAVVGIEELMRELNPKGNNPVPHAGTFSGNPVSMAAGATALKLFTPEVVERMNNQGNSARIKLNSRVTLSGWEVRGQGSLLRPFPVGQEYSEVLQRKLWWAAYDRGVLLSPANLACLSSPMTDQAVDEIVDRLTDAILYVSETSF